MTKSFVIAVDGPAASGKGTLSRQLAAHFGLAHLDTGALYRGLALLALSEGVDLQDTGELAALASQLDQQILQSPQLRTPAVGEAASVIAGHQAVRDALLTYQRDFAAQLPGAVLDGRDIGTVVCPDATVKLFVTASVDERAQRRYKELAECGNRVTLTEIKAEIEARDARDRQRNVAPLKQSDDAHLLDTTNLDIETALSAAVLLVETAKKTKSSAR